MDLAKTTLLAAMFVLFCRDHASCHLPSSNLLKRITSMKNCVGCTERQDGRPLAFPHLQMQVNKTGIRSKRQSTSTAIKDPFYETPDGQVYLQRGQTQHIPCRSRREGEDVSVVLWVAGEDRIARFTVVPGDANFTLSDRYGLSHKHGLIINQVEVGDTGEYVCIVAPKEGPTIQRRESISVLTLDQAFPFVDDDLASDNATLTLTPGEQHVLNCSVRSPFTKTIPLTSTIYWSLDVGKNNTIIIGVKFSDGVTTVTDYYQDDYEILENGALLAKSLQSNHSRFWCHLSVEESGRLSGYVDVIRKGYVDVIGEDTTSGMMPTPMDDPEQKNNTALIIALVALPVVACLLLIFVFRKRRCMREGNRKYHAEAFESEPLSQENPICLVGENNIGSEDETKVMNEDKDQETKSFLKKDTEDIQPADSDRVIDRQGDCTPGSSSTTNVQNNTTTINFLKPVFLKYVKNRTHTTPPKQRPKKVFKLIPSIRASASKKSKARKPEEAKSTSNAITPRCQQSGRDSIPLEPHTELKDTPNSCDHEPSSSVVDNHDSKHVKEPETIATETVLGDNRTEGQEQTKRDEVGRSKSESPNQPARYDSVGTETNTTKTEDKQDKGNEDRGTTSVPYGGSAQTPPFVAATPPRSEITDAQCNPQELHGDAAPPGPFVPFAPVPLPSQPIETPEHNIPQSNFGGSEQSPCHPSDISSVSPLNYPHNTPSNGTKSQNPLSSDDESMGSTENINGEEVRAEPSLAEPQSGDEMETASKGPIKPPADVYEQETNMDTQSGELPRRSTKRRADSDEEGNGEDIEKESKEVIKRHKKTACRSTRVR